MSPTAATSYNQFSKQQLVLVEIILDVGLRVGISGKLSFPYIKSLVVVTRGRTGYGRLVIGHEEGTGPQPP